MTINLAFGENGLITRAQWAQEQYEIEQVREKLEMAKGSAFADGKGSIDPDHYFDIIEDEGIIGNKENDVKDNGDGTYEVTTNEGYIFEITLVPTKENPEDIEIDYIGKGESTRPRISTIDVTGKTTNSISVKVEGKNLDGAEYTYYYKKSSEGEESWKEYSADKSSNTCTISGLETKVVYDIKVVVTTSKGTDEKQISEITGELAEGSITIGNTEWQGDGTAKVTVTTDITEPGSYIEYKVGADGSWTRIESGNEITLQLNDEVYVRVTDGTNSLKDAYRKIEDTTNPIISKIETSNITSDSITVTVTAVDNESGLATSGTYKYYLNDGEAITSTNNIQSFTGLSAETQYTIKVETFDKAGNMEDDIVTVSTLEIPLPTTVEEAIEDGRIYPNTTPITDASGDTVWIPGGFGIAEDSANDVDAGVVIEDAKKNQFVWIPVNSNDLNEMYIISPGTKISDLTTATTNVYSKLRFTQEDQEIWSSISPADEEIDCREPDILAGWADTETGNDNMGINAIKNILKIKGNNDSEILNNYAQSLVDEYTANYESIKKYKGFYIGRFEITGTVSEPTVKSKQNVLSADIAGNWYYLKQACTNVVSTSYAQTIMPYGNQYDEIMDWILDTGNKTYYQIYTNSSDWGNYDTASGGTEKKEISGSNEKWKANNIYDIAGNCQEWTQEANNTAIRILHGGCYRYPATIAPAASRNTGITDYSDQYTSSRPALYIK